MNDIAARFQRIRAHYKRHHDAIMADGSEWFDDGYSWDHEAGITLTPIEDALWHDIRAESLILYPQYPVGRFFVDFGNPVHKVAIECDGAKWHTDATRDQARQVEIEAMGWSVYRISGRLCITDLTERIDEQGRPMPVISMARALVRDIKARHPYIARRGYGA